MCIQPPYIRPEDCFKPIQAKEINGPPSANQGSSTTKPRHAHGHAFSPFWRTKVPHSMLYLPGEDMAQYVHCGIFRHSDLNAIKVKKPLMIRNGDVHEVNRLHDLV